MKQSKIFIALSIFGLSMLVGTTAIGQTVAPPTTNYSVPAPHTPCSPTAQQSVANSSQEQLALAHRTLDQINARLLQDHSDANGASATSLIQQCVGQYWPGAGFRLPTLQDLMNAAKALIAAECALLRQKISSSLPSMQSLQINSGIPGLPPIGYSASTTNGAAPVWTVNGQNPTTGLGNLGTTQQSSISTQISQSLPSTPTPAPAPAATPTTTPTPSLIDKAKNLFGG